MFTVPATIKSFHAFAQDERGAVAVDFVVLTGAAAAMAMAAMAAFSAEVGFISGEVAAGAQDRDSRPSYAYRAHDRETYVRYMTAVSSLSTNDLGVLSAWGNATRQAQGDMTDPAAVRFFEDFDNAITTAYAHRELSRDEGTEYDAYDLERVSRMLGFSS